MKHIFVSPHFDDVALSCGGRIIGTPSRCEDVLVVNIFTSEPAAADDPQEKGLALFDSLNSDRTFEDKTAWSEIEVRSLHANLPEALLRKTFPFRFFKTGCDDGIIDDIYELVADLAASNPRATFYFPAGFGSHVDHLACQRAAFRLLDEERLDRIILYEDIPYSWLKFVRKQHYKRLLQTVDLDPQDDGEIRRREGESLWTYLWQEDVPFPRGKKLFPAVYASLLVGNIFKRSKRRRSYIGKVSSIRLDDIQMERKRTLISRYQSQIPMLFGKNPDRVLRDLRDCFSKEVTIEIARRA